MEESKQQLLFQMQQQQQRQQQLFLMQHLQKQQQQQQAMPMSMSRFPSNNLDANFRPPGFIQNRPVNPILPSSNLNPNSGPNLFQQTNNFQQQQQQNVNSQQMMMMMMMQQQQQQQQQQKSMRPTNQLELQFAYQDAWRVCHPDVKRPFASLEDACERLLPYHVAADYEAEEDDRILESDTTGETIPRCQQWDNNIAAKVAEYMATFEKQAETFNKITQKRRNGELRGEERLMIEQALMQDERQACFEVKSELDREVKAQQEARFRMTAFAAAQGGQVKAESHQSHLACNPLRANAIGNHGEQRRNMNPDEMMMMMMHGWGNHNNNNNLNGQREEKEPLEDFLNDEEHENGETGQRESWRGNGEFDLNTR